VFFLTLSVGLRSSEPSSDYQVRFSLGFGLLRYLEIFSFLLRKFVFFNIFFSEASLT
jgi:hypothetical protein